MPDIALVEELVHLPMLFHPHPRRILVVSGGVGGVLNEILKHPVERVDYAELDPLLIEAVQKFPTPLTVGELSDPRVNIEHVDGRLLVRRLAAEGNERYDLVIVNLPYPVTLQLNRFYTVEFFRLVREILTQEGVVALPSPGTGSEVCSETHQLTSSSPWIRQKPISRRAKPAGERQGSITHSCMMSMPFNLLRKICSSMRTIVNPSPDFGRDRFQQAFRGVETFQSKSCSQAW